MAGSAVEVEGEVEVCTRFALFAAFCCACNRIHPPTAGHQTPQALRRGHDGESSIHCKSLIPGTNPVGYP